MRGGGGVVVVFDFAVEDEAQFKMLAIPLGTCKADANL